MLIVLYIFLLVILMFCISKSIKFFKYFFKNPLLPNSYASFIPSNFISDSVIYNNNGSFSSVIELDGFSYYQSGDLTKDIENNIVLKNRALNFSNLKENMHLKFVFKKLESKIIYAIEITASDFDNLLEITSSLTSSLKNFNPSILTNDDLKNYLFYCINLVEKKLISDVKLSDLCSYSNVFFENDYGVLQNFDTKKYFKVYSFNFGSSINCDFFKALMHSNLQFDYIINTKFFNNFATKVSLSTDKKNINASRDKDGNITTSAKKVSELKEAQEILDNEEASLCVCDVFIILYATNDKDLYESSINLKDILNSFEILLTQETALLNFFFLQKIVGFSLHNTFKFLLPQADYLVYAKKVLSSTLAGMFDYINIPSGLNSCDWGDNAITTFNSSYNALYNFNFHISKAPSALAHGIFVAPSGSGKTTLALYLIDGCLKNFDIDIYIFDRFSGCEIFTKYKNHTLIDFDNQSINPLLLDLDIEENKLFLNNFLTMLADAQDALDIQIINNFVNAIALLDYSDRKLKELTNSLIPQSKVKDNMDKWINGKYASYISELDISLDDDNMYTFAMEKILDNEDLAPIIYFMMFKIQQKAKKTGRGHFIFIDEAAAMLKNPYFKDKIEVLLQEHRKLRGAVWLAFQNPQSFLKSSIKELLLGQCQSKFIYSSHSISTEILNQMQIDEKVYKELENLIKVKKNPYYVLLQKPNENVILDVNLKNKIPLELKFYSSSANDVNKVRELIEQYGEKWREYY